MRPLVPALALSLLCAAPVFAQTTPAAAPPAASSAALPAASSAAMVDDLPITAPPNSTVQVDMDVRDDDLLGVFKSLLKGVSEGGQAAAAANQTPPPGTTPAARRVELGRQVAGIMSNADLADILKDVTHVRFLVYQLKPKAGHTITSVVPKGKKSPAAPAPPVTADMTTSYETQFAAEGGHRVLYVNYDPVHVVMVSFGHARGSALVVQAPGTLAIMRVNGYPDLSKLSALATQIGTVAAQAAATAPPSDKGGKDEIK